MQLIALETPPEKIPSALRFGPIADIPVTRGKTFDR
jgi:hypothetical protein